MVTDGLIVLRASAYVELHMWLAASAKTDADVDRELEPAKAAYRRSLEDDDDDARLDRTTRALARCADDRCAGAAVAPEGFGHAYARALPVFATARWGEHAKIAWTGIESALAALSGTVEAPGAGDALFLRAGSELDVGWPERVEIDVVSEAPPVARAALFSRPLAARGPCFRRKDGPESERVRAARVLDCLLVRALLHPGVTSPHRRTLVERLGPESGERAWALLATTVAVGIVRGWEPKHESVDRRSAETVERSRLEWLAKNWRAPRGEALDRFIELTRSPAEPADSATK